MTFERQEDEHHQQTQQEDHYPQEQPKTPIVSLQKEKTPN